MLKNYCKFIDKCTNNVQGDIEKSFEMKDFLAFANDSTQCLTALFTVKTGHE